MKASATGRAIREKRLAAGLTQKALAASSGISESHISNIEHGRVSPSLRTIARIARACGTTVDIIISEA